MSNNVDNVFALRYAERPSCLSSEAFYRHDLYNEPNVPIGMDYFFWLVQSNAGSVVIDCGFSEEMGPARGRWATTPPAELLSRMGTNPSSVEHVVLTHMHFDHVGNTHLFPNAMFHMTRAEFEYWTGPYRDRPAFSWPVESKEVELLQSLHREERLHLIEDDGEIVPGVRAMRFPGHTPGQIVTEVSHDTGKIVLASDAMHYYDEIDRDRPFYLFTDLEELFDSYGVLRGLDEQPGVSVIPGHDPLVSSEYVEVESNSFDLSSRRDAPTRRVYKSLR